MAAEQTSEQVWSWVGTPNPAEKIFALYVETQLITIDTPEKPSNMPKRESAIGVDPYTAPTKFKDLDPAFNSAHLCSLGVAEWYFIGESIGPKTSVFYFFKNKTDEELATPWQVVQKKGNHYWHPIVFKCWIESDYSFPVNAGVISGSKSGMVVGPTNYVRDVVLADAEEGSTFTISRYLSATRPPKSNGRVPQPQQMNVEVNGASKNYGKVLHPRIIIKETASASASSVNGKTVQGIGGGVSQQIFPATNITSRKPYILTDEPTQNEMGLWERVVTKVRPPKIRNILRS